MNELLRNMLASLNAYKNRSREDLISECIAARLAKSTDNYIEDLMRSAAYLNNHASNKNIRRITK